jgi:hypothetical protein
MALLTELFDVGGAVFYKHNTPSGVKLWLTKASGTIKPLKTA